MPQTTPETLDSADEYTTSYQIPKGYFTVIARDPVGDFSGTLTLQATDADGNPVNSTSTITSEDVLTGTSSGSDGMEWRMYATACSAGALIVSFHWDR